MRRCIDSRSVGQWVSGSVKQRTVIRGNEGACPLDKTEDRRQMTEDRGQMTGNRQERKLFEGTRGLAPLHNWEVSD
jgi:hypothetical protein